MDLELKGKVALVTAASRGIGRAVALQLAADGAHVAVSARSQDQLESLTTQITDFGGSASAHPVDLGDARATDALVPDVVHAHGGLDILVANTPGPTLKPFLDTTTSDWSAAYEMLLRPMVQLSHGAAEQMVQRRSGSIVFMTSTWVKQPPQGGVLSASLRAAVSALSKTLAQEFAADGVRVNQVMPGATGTDRMTQIVSNKAARNGTTPEQETTEVVADIPLGRWADPSEVAAAVAFLASPRSGFTTGSAWQIDGGAVRSTV